MLETSTSGLMSGDGKTERAPQSTATAPVVDSTADRFEEVSLSDWLAHSPIDMVAETLNLDPSVIKQFPGNRPEIVPA